MSHECKLKISCARLNFHQTEPSVMIFSPTLIGNNMISHAVWFKQALINILKTTNCTCPVAHTILLCLFYS